MRMSCTWSQAVVGRVPKGQYSGFGFSADHTGPLLEQANCLASDNGLGGARDVEQRSCTVRAHRRRRQRAEERPAPSDAHGFAVDTFLSAEAFLDGMVPIGQLHFQACLASNWDAG